MNGNKTDHIQLWYGMGFEVTCCHDGGYDLVSSDSLVQCHAVSISLARGRPQSCDKAWIYFMQNHEFFSKFYLRLGTNCYIQSQFEMQRTEKKDTLCPNELTTVANWIFLVIHAFEIWMMLVI